MIKDVFTWTYVVFAVISLIVCASIVGLSLAFVPDAIPVGIAGAVSYLTVFFIITRCLPIWRSGSLLWVIISMYWGGFVVVGTIFPTSSAISDLVKTAGLDRLEASASGAIPEEIGKAAGVFVILFMARRVWDRPWHGLLAGFSVGMGFEIVENLLYGSVGAPSDPTSDVHGAFESWVVRTCLGFGLHAMLTGLSGFAIASALMVANKSMAWRLGVGAGGVLAAIGFHGWWNVQWPESFGIFLMFPGWIGLTAIIVVILKKHWQRAKNDRQRPLPSHKKAWKQVPV
ncbi:PrsW family intramembrane metalloprotease [Corynebacterium kroppenstedtii]|uniref:PrsW family intramembrane metalloprotease n=1 Tax=Corynebacterium sp. PCR 32 TaxID=3351342 RepID=UPI0030988F42